MVARLSALYPQREAESMANMLIQHYFGLTRVAQQLQIEKRLSESELLTINKAVARLLKAEPIQYVLGRSTFYGLEMDVSAGVLIPRPETEELVDWVVKGNHNEQADILDVGTGSGCIALALKNTFAGSHVTAVDISEEALAVARKNAERLHLDVDFIRCDILDTPVCQNSLKKEFDIVVSNPPYVLQKEKGQMAGNVLNYEPHEALFVEDDDPLLFYRKIIHFAGQSLRPGGRLYFEVNEKYANETGSLADKNLFEAPEISTDFRGKERFVSIARRS